MAARIITTSVEVIGADECVQKIEKITQAFNELAEALKTVTELKKDFNALFSKNPD